MNIINRTVIICLWCMIFSVAANAQNAVETSVKYNKQQHTGITADYKSGKEETEGALLAKLKAAGLNSKKKKNGFYVYSAVNWTEIMPEKIDVYVKISGSRKKSVIEMMIAKGYDNFITTASDPEAIDKVKNILNNLPADISAYRNAQELAARQAAVAKAQKELKEADRKAALAARKHEREAAKRAKKQARLEEQQKQLSELK
ncbi:hypothetical protein ACTHGU_03520 [Chitinophagaceae bacterium MMS25-I14]